MICEFWYPQGLYFLVSVGHAMPVVLKLYVAGVWLFISVILEAVSKANGWPIDIYIHTHTHTHALNLPLNKEFAISPQG